MELEKIQALTKKENVSQLEEGFKEKVGSTVGLTLQAFACSLVDGIARQGTLTNVEVMDCDTDLEPTDAELAYFEDLVRDLQDNKYENSSNLLHAKVVQIVDYNLIC